MMAGLVFRDFDVAARLSIDSCPRDDELICHEYCHMADSSVNEFFM